MLTFSIYFAKISFIGTRLATYSHCLSNLTSIDTNMKKLSTVMLMTLAGVMSTRAAITMSMEQVGDDLVISYSGTVNTAALTTAGTASDAPRIYGVIGVVSLGGPLTSQDVDPYRGTNNPGGYITTGSSNLFADASTGDKFAILAFNSSLYLPDGYVSETFISGSATFNNATRQSLGFNDGVYHITWGSGPTADSVTFIVPEPATYGLLSGFAVLALLIRRRR